MRIVFPQVDKELQFRPDVILFIFRIGSNEGRIEGKPDFVHAKTSDRNQPQRGAVELARSGGADKKLGRPGGVVLACNASTTGIVNSSRVVIGHVWTVGPLFNRI